MTLHTIEQGFVRAADVAAGVGGNDANTLLLLHCDGVNGSTTFTDSSIGGADSPRAVTANGNAKVSTANSKFGGASALFDGSGDTITTPGSNDFKFGTGDFTIDFWFMQTAAFPGVVGLFALDQYNQSGCEIFLRSGGNLNFDDASGSGASQYAFTFSTNTWYHIAAVRSSGVLTLYINGVAGYSRADTANYNPTDGVMLGYRPEGGISYLTGRMDEVRISNIARWTTDFTPPASAYN